ncbi:MAG: helix-turn-helix transcriptional regulator [SAR324 cluster bacterium]|nr:helix-turn-helix transcriptional regulator [SAR324 cluster bacterium]
MSNQLGIFLKEQLSNHQINIAALSVLTQISENRLDKIIAGASPSSNELIKLAANLNLNLDELKKRSNSVSNNTSSSSSVNKNNHYSVTEGQKFSQLFSNRLAELSLSVDAVATLLNTPLSTIRGITKGTIPDTPLLIDVCILLNFNYQEIVRLINSDQLGQVFFPYNGEVGFDDVNRMKINGILSAIGDLVKSETNIEVLNMVSNQCKLVHDSLVNRYRE